MAVSMADLVDDIAAETAALRPLLVGLADDETGWDRPTPAAGWSIRDQVSHLAYFDDVAVRSATDPEAFSAELARLLESGGVDTEKIAARYRDMPGDELLAWFDKARAGLMDTFGALDPTLRVPWFGPAMSTDSSLTARIMETWAHGQDVVDALGAEREPSSRMRHVAHICVGARPFSYVTNGRTPPTEPAPRGADRPGRRHLGLGAGGRGEPGDRDRARLLPAGDPAAAPRRHRPGRHRAGGRRMAVHRPGLRGPARHRAASRPVPEELAATLDPHSRRWRAP